MSLGRVYVVDDEAPIRRASALMLKVMGYEARAFDDGRSFLDELATLDHGCLLLDIRMPTIDGLEVQHRLNSDGAPLPVIVMSGHGDLGMAVPAMENGAVCFLEKPFSRAALQSALDIAFLKLEGGPGFERYLAEARQTVQALDEAETKILALIVRGRSNEAIAGELGLPGSTIDMRRARIFARLGVDSVTDALRVAFAAGLGATQ
jgi:two-component system response regulator FixJ